MRAKAGQDKGRLGAAKLRMGDRVRLKSDGPDGPEWLVVAYSYGKDTFDLMACNPRAPQQFQNGMSAEELDLVERVADETEKND